MRGAAILLLLAAPACSRSDTAEATRDERAAAPAASARQERLACRIGGAPQFAEDCTVERSFRNGIETLVVHHPDGGFRRFDVLDNGRGLAVADGATQAVTRFADGFAELAVEGDAYRFPITVKPGTGNARP